MKKGKQIKSKTPDWTTTQITHIMKMELVAFLIFTIIYAVIMGIILYYVYTELPQEYLLFGKIGIFVQDTARIFSYAIWTVISSFIYLRFKHRFEN